MNIKALSLPDKVRARRILRQANASQPARMAEIPVSFKYLSTAEPPFRSWRSREFLAQLYREPGERLRLSINRSEIVLPSGDWRDGITWDELMRVKDECGFGDQWAVEIYPPGSAVVNVANIRHLWLLPSPPAFGWRLAP